MSSLYRKIYQAFLTFVSHHLMLLILLSRHSYTFYYYFLVESLLWRYRKLEVFKHHPFYLLKELVVGFSSVIIFSVLTSFFIYLIQNKGLSRLFVDYLPSLCYYLFTIYPTFNKSDRSVSFL